MSEGRPTTVGFCPHHGTTGPVFRVDDKPYRCWNCYSTIDETTVRDTGVSSVSNPFIANLNEAETEYDQAFTDLVEHQVAGIALDEERIEVEEVKATIVQEAATKGKNDSERKAMATLAINHSETIQSFAKKERAHQCELIRREAAMKLAREHMLNRRAILEATH